MNFFERKIVNIFLPLNLNMFFGCSKEPSRDSSSEYQQQVCRLRTEKNNEPQQLLCGARWLRGRVLVLRVEGLPVRRLCS